MERIWLETWFTKKTFWISIIQRNSSCFRWFWHHISIPPHSNNTLVQKIKQNICLCIREKTRDLSLEFFLRKNLQLFWFISTNWYTISIFKCGSVDHNSRLCFVSIESSVNKKSHQWSNPLNEILSWWAGFYWLQLFNFHLCKKWIRLGHRNRRSAEKCFYWYLSVHYPRSSRCINREYCFLH